MSKDIDDSVITCSHQPNFGMIFIAAPSAG